ncbi:MAG: sigma-70 family RNA polymerase sigma factor [Fuerstiella sp.]|nr:sigma-70 family RNA polymerase sigma factor [Fuerstiella sp.]
MSAEFNIQTVLRAQAGNRDAFDKLTKTFYSRVYAIVIQRLRNTAEADEVTQEVFLRAYRKMTQLKDPSAFAGWLCRIAVRLAINRAVRRPTERTCEPVTFEQLQEADTGPTANLLQREDAQQLRSGIDQLGQMDRQTLMAFYFEGQSLKDMAEVFDSPVGTIKRRLHTARHRLREMLAAMQPA